MDYDADFVKAVLASYTTRSHHTLTTQHNTTRSQHAMSIATALVMPDPDASLSISIPIPIPIIIPLHANVMLWHDDAPVDPWIMHAVVGREVRSVRGG
jgi:hypothetical protein